MARYGFAFFDSGVRFDQPDAHPTSMRNLSRFLENPFDDRNISMDELLAFSTDHLQKVTSLNSGGDWDDHLPGLTSAIEQTLEFTGSDEIKLGFRKAKVAGKDAYRKALPGKISRIVSSFEGTFGDNPGLLQDLLLQLLPSGQKIFHDCRDDRLVTHLDPVRAICTAQAAQLPAAIVTLAQSLHAGWDAVYDASESAKGQKNASAQARRAARENLQLMLYRSLIKLMELFPRQPEKLALYMQQSLLENPTRNAEDEEPEPEVPPSEG